MRSSRGGEKNSGNKGKWFLLEELGRAVSGARTGAADGLPEREAGNDGCA